MSELWLVTGGARSGKSRFAERLAAGTGRPVVYLATMEPLDDELHDRVARHRDRRPAGWRTVEAPLDPVTALRDIEPAACVLLDCISLWVSNRLLLEAGEGEAPGARVLDALDAMLCHEAEDLAAAAAERDAETVVVTNEVGAGLVPDNALGRAYRDLLGRVNQRLSARASRAWLLVAGRALELPPAQCENDPPRR